MIMRAEEECLSYSQIHKLLIDLIEYCDNLDCEGVSAVLNSAVSGFDDRPVRYDHLWTKQKKLRQSDAVLASNVQELFRDKP